MYRALSGNKHTAVRGLNLYAWLLMGEMSLKATALSISEAKGEFQKILHLSCELGGELHKVLWADKSTPCPPLAVDSLEDGVQPWRRFLHHHFSCKCGETET